MKDRAILVEDWRRGGIQEGDTVLVHSSLRKTFRKYLKHGIKLSVEDILFSFITAVGPSGTLLLPLFNFDFASGVPFDIRNTPSHMGALTEAGRKHPGAVRTGHPIYSFAVLGAHADRFQDVDNHSGYGADSPFAILRELDGNIAVLNLSDQDSMTFYHHIEEMHQVPYRYMKEFSGEYTDAEGVTTLRTYSLFVRDLEKGVLTHVNPMGELLWTNKLYKGERPNQGNGLRVISARAMYKFVSDIIETGDVKGLLYKIGEE
jgi:aminoglycoside N3'-acetyltransferase